MNNASDGVRLSSTPINGEAGNERDSSVSFESHFFTDYDLDTPSRRRQSKLRESLEVPGKGESNQESLCISPLTYKENVHENYREEKPSSTKKLQLMLSRNIDHSNRARRASEINQLMPNPSDDNRKDIVPNLLQLNDGTDASQVPVELKKSVLKRIKTYLDDPNTPYILSLYLQLLLNFFVVAIALYLAYTFISTVKQDVNIKTENYITDALQEISLCSREYYRNKCDPESGKTRAPALEKACTMWSKCMNRDPTLVGRSKLSAETFADIVNGFVKPISWKALIFIGILFIGTLTIGNISFKQYRASSESYLHAINSYKAKIEQLEYELEQERQARNKREKNEGSIARKSQAGQLELRNKLASEEEDLSRRHVSYTQILHKISSNSSHIG